MFLVLFIICFLFFFFFFNDTATTEIYTLSLHDALPILLPKPQLKRCATDTRCPLRHWLLPSSPRQQDRKSTRLNSSHVSISYAVFCLKKKTILTTYFTLLNKTHKHSTM